jgi:hypothetical protein
MKQTENVMGMLKIEKSPPTYLSPAPARPSKNWNF